MFKSILNFTTGTIYLSLVTIAVIWGIYSGYVFYKEYLSHPTASISQEVIDAKVAKLNAEEQARMKAEKEQLNKKYNLK